MKRLSFGAAVIFALAVSGGVLGAQSGFNFDFTEDDNPSAASEGEDFTGGFDFAGGEAGASGDTGTFSSLLQAVQIGGDVKLDARCYVDDPKQTDGKSGASEGEDAPLYATPDATLDFNYQNESSEVNFKLNFSQDSIETYHEDVIEEATARAYLGDFIIEGGKEKLVWGKGDKLHVLDNFCGTDFTDFIYPDYIDRRLAVPMLRAIYNEPSGVFRAEAVYAPFLVPDRFADDDGEHGTKYWMPYQIKVLKSMAAQNIMGISSPSMKNIAAASKLQSDADDVLYPDTQKLKYSQYGVRITGTAGSFDWGVSYYLGWNKQPSVDMKKLQSYITDYIAQGKSALETGVDYDRLQVFGLEGAKAFGALNTRFEASYNLTEDIEGDDPAVRNNSISWLPGFDIDLPLHNINVNVQEIGTVTLHADKIKDNGPLDVDHDSKNRYTNNKIAVNITDTFLHENLKFDVTGTWGLERGDFVLVPKVTYTVKTGFDLAASGMWVYCRDEDAEFYEWRHNSFAQVGARYRF